MEAAAEHSKSLKKHTSQVSQLFMCISDVIIFTDPTQIDIKFSMRSVATGCCTLPNFTTSSTAGTMGCVAMVAGSHLEKGTWALLVIAAARISSHWIV